MSLIELHGVGRSFGGEDGRVVEALSDVSLDIDSGEFVCITGPSGSGKSTLLNIIGCLDPPSDGAYRFAGARVDFDNGDLLARLRRDAIGFVFQNCNLLESASALRNVELPAAYCGIGYAQRKRRGRELLESFGLAQHLDHRPAELSGGEKQRVAMARALMNGPRLIIADEPTAAMDTAQSAEFSALLSDLADQGHAVLAASHDGAIADRASRQIELRDGRVVADTAIREPSRTNEGFSLPETVGGGTRVSRLLAVLRESSASLCESPSRAAATAFSSTLAVGSVVILLGIVNGTEHRVREMLEHREIIVSAWGSPNDAPVRLGVSDADAIRTEIPNIREVELRTEGVLKIQRGSVVEDVGVEAQSRLHPVVAGQDWPLARGAYLTENDRMRRAQVALLGPTSARLLFDDNVDPVGEHVQLGGVPFLVKGVLDEYPLGPGFDHSDEIANDRRDHLGRVVYVPLETALEILDRSPGATPGSQTYASGIRTPLIEVGVSDAAIVEEVTGDVRDLLIRRHGRESFDIWHPAQNVGFHRGLWSRPLAIQNGVAVTAVVAATAAVSTIMLLWVSARRREIGVRIAVGATRRDIATQVATETSVASAVGGVLGVLSGYWAGPTVAAVITPTGFQQIPVAFSAWFVPAAVGCALALGLLAAAVPALRAARLDAVEALAP